MTIHFLFDGGNYKRLTDSGRMRTPLTDVDTQMVFADPELSHKTPTSIGTVLHMEKYADVLSGLEVGDEIIVGLVPDAALLRGIWIGAFDTVDGFTVTADLVSARDVWDEYQSNGDEATGVATFPDTSTVDYDFSNGLGDATKDAMYKAKMYGGTISEFRNEEALVVQPFATPAVAGLGDVTYMRLTVTDLGEFGENATSGCCNDCGNTKYPTLQMGVILDILCFDKQRVTKFCNCGAVTCAGDCGNSDEPVTVE